jgi:hypothetical protein
MILSNLHSKHVPFRLQRLLKLIRNLNLYHENANIFKHVLIYSAVLCKCVWIILLLYQSQEIYLQHDCAAECNIFGFRCTGIRNCYVAAIAANGKRLEKMFLC